MTSDEWNEKSIVEFAQAALAEVEAHPDRDQFRKLTWCLPVPVGMTELQRDVFLEGLRRQRPEWTIFFGEYDTGICAAFTEGALG